MPPRPNVGVLKEKQPFVVEIGSHLLTKQFWLFPCTILPWDIHGISHGYLFSISQKTESCPTSQVSRCGWSRDESDVLVLWLVTLVLVLVEVISHHRWACHSHGLLPSLWLSLQWHWQPPPTPGGPAAAARPHGRATVAPWHCQWLWPGVRWRDSDDSSTQYICKLLR